MSLRFLCPFRGDEKSPDYRVQECFSRSDKMSLRSSRANGSPCIARSKTSTLFVRVPVNSILIFSQTWGSGTNGARPRVRQAPAGSGVELISAYLPYSFVGGRLSINCHQFVCYFRHLLDQRLSSCPEAKRGGSLIDEHPQAVYDGAFRMQCIF